MEIEEEPSKVQHKSHQYQSAALVSINNQTGGLQVIPCHNAGFLNNGAFTSAILAQAAKSLLQQKWKFHLLFSLK